MKNKILILLIVIVLYFLSIYKDDILIYINHKGNKEYYDINNIPEYSGKDYITINDNEPNFLDNYSIEESFENYYPLDNLDRATGAFAIISTETMPTKKRESINMIKPSGWHIAKYDIIEDKYLYNRCHLIAYQFTGENANEKNLITCTKYMNSVSMLEFENKVAYYIRKTNNHVLYRVTPIYYQDNLLATGVQIEAKSIEDDGKGIKFNVFIYNIQEGITIDYKTGDSYLNIE